MELFVDFLYGNTIRFWLFLTYQVCSALSLKLVYFFIFTILILRGIVYGMLKWEYNQILDY